MKRIAIITSDKKLLLNYEDNTFCELSECEKPEPGEIGRICITKTSIRDRTYRDPGYVTYCFTYGCINDKMEEIIPCEYESIEIHKELVIADKNHTYSFFDKTGKLIYESQSKEEQIALNLLHNDWVNVVEFGKLKFSKGQKRDSFGPMALWGTVSCYGDTIREQKYDSISIDRKGLIVKFKRFEHVDTAIWFNGLHDWITYCDCNFELVSRQKGLLILNDNGHPFVLNEFNIQPRERTCLNIKIINNIAIIQDTWLESYGLEKIECPNTGAQYKHLLEYEYDLIDPFSNSAFFRVVKDNKQGIYNTETESFEIDPCVPLTFELIANSAGDNCVAFKENDKSGFMDKSGKVLFYFSPDIKISSIHPFCSDFGLAKVQIYGENSIETLNFSKNGTYEQIERPTYRGQEEPDYGADTFDALTDGMYGDYPGSSVDYDDIS